MATNILSVGTAPATSTPFTLADGAAATLITDGESISNGQPTGFVEVQKADGAWRTFGSLNTSGVTVVQADGTFRVRRGDTGASMGVDRG